MVYSSISLLSSSLSPKTCDNWEKSLKDWDKLHKKANNFVKMFATFFIGVETIVLDCENW